uniref:Bardet-biedl syndrome 4 n=1 Tax=Tetraselmis sp. GSL018 TaxID=582737 RepID=A0A061SP97_9CHLO|mmetsp:Transcript_13463/g.31883  ORF Transcript_13463/g.31883 Transcript_13463/m.31883 type:complete len:230 (-) Transcript_13463:684-1373(-)
MARKENINAFLHQLFLRQDFSTCLEFIESQIEVNGPEEYPVFLKATIKRQQGKIQESLQLFQEAAALNPGNPTNLKQVARSLFLLGKHKAAIDVYAETARMAGREDRESAHNRGLCFVYMKDYASAITAFQEANGIERHDSTYMQMAKVYMLMDDYQSAANVCLEAIEFSPENSEMLTTLGSARLLSRTPPRSLPPSPPAKRASPGRVKTSLPRSLPFARPLSLPSLGG